MSDIGGDLVQWHTHDDLCFSPEGYVSALTDASGACPAGRIPDGEARLCDHAHGSAS